VLSLLRTYALELSIRCLVCLSHSTTLLHESEYFFSGSLLQVLCTSSYFLCYCSINKQSNGRYGNVLLFVLNSRQEHRDRAGYDGEEFTIGDLTTGLGIARPLTTISSDATHMSMSVPNSRMMAQEKSAHEKDI